MKQNAETVKFQTMESNKTKHSLLMPLNFFKFENTITVSSLAKQTQVHAGKKLAVGMTCGFNETDDSFISDLVN